METSLKRAQWWQSRVCRQCPVHYTHYQKLNEDSAVILLQPLKSAGRDWGLVSDVTVFTPRFQHVTKLMTPLKHLLLPGWPLVSPDPGLSTPIRLTPSHTTACCMMSEWKQSHEEYYNVGRGHNSFSMANPDFISTCNTAVSVCVVCRRVAHNEEKRYINMYTTILCAIHRVFTARLPISRI